MLDVFFFARICGCAVYSWSGRMQNPFLNISCGLVNFASFVCSRCAVNGLGGKFVHLGDFVKAVWISHVSGHQSDPLRGASL